HLVNLFGDVPLILSTKYQQNQSIPRSSEEEVYNQIINDLNASKDSLDKNYPSDERAQPNKYTAEALLARVYLYNHDWADAEKESSAIISSGIYSISPDLNSVFLSNSNETIWQLKPTTPYADTWEGYDIIPYSDQSSPTYLITNDLINSFEPGDARLSAWTKSENFSNQIVFYPYKYKVNFPPPDNEYYVVFRLAEQYLIRAEARANQNNLMEAESDVNVIRNRAGLGNITTSDKDSLLNAIAHERRIELFAEWGHRWFDLKRTGQAEQVLKQLKPDTWQATDTLWPIPQSQLLLNSALTQNPGY
ncbi:MAG TPA: RagB/SusD family nutrient uptake outer membrane protein, partial [Hanamia sp.]|nr:RagB/SusD family nutrient uptake outer membrane protein [Hanamia sp.]